MLSFDELERRWQATRPQTSGEVRVLVIRLGQDAHATPSRIDVSPEAAIAGDRWAVTDNRHPEAQVSLIERRVAEILVGDDPSRLHVPGDNLVVDLDLSVAALPVGARLEVGGALIEITAKPHAGCAKFGARVGRDALRWVNVADHRPRRLRGVFGRILRGGSLAVGDRIVRRE
jgi:hypothetical protein